MSKRNPYRDHVDPEYQRWGRVYRGFPGVQECVRLVQSGEATGAWADIVHAELAENATDCLGQMVDAFRSQSSDKVATCLLTALETAALPESVDFLAEVLRDGDATRAEHARHALTAIDTKEARRALFDATGKSP